MSSCAKMDHCTDVVSDLLLLLMLMLDGHQGLTLPVCFNFQMLLFQNRHLNIFGNLLIHIGLS